MKPWKRCSASQINAFRRCPARWYAEKIEGRSAPPSEAMKRGTRIHAALERYLADAVALPDDDDGRIAAAALPLLPAAGAVPRADVERSFRAPDEVFGIPMQGIIDLVEPDGRITDHKTTSNFKHAKTEEEVRGDAQAQIYAIEAARTGAADPVRFRLVYMRTKGAAKASEVGCSFTRDDLAAALDTLRRDVDAMKATATKEAAEVPHNLEACGDYGGCPHRARCAELGRPTLGIISGLFTTQGATKMDPISDPLAAMLAGRNTPADIPPETLAASINPPDGTPEMELPPPAEVEAQQELADIEPVEVTRKRRALRLPGTVGEDGKELLVSRASKDQLVAFATENKILVAPPEGRRSPGIREYRESVEAFVAFVEPDPVAETWTEPAPVIEPTIAGTGTGLVAPPVDRGMAETAPAAVPSAPLASERAPWPVDPPGWEKTILYLNCTPRGEVTYLEDLLAPLARRVGEEAGAVHYLALPYGGGPKQVASMLAHEIRTSALTLSGPIVADLRLPATEAAVEVLLPYVDDVVRSF